MNVHGSQGAARAPERAQRLRVFVPPRVDWGPGRRGEPEGRTDGGFGADTPVRFVATWPGGREERGTAAVRALPRARSSELVFSALDVFCGTVSVPRLSDARLRQALPHLLEERLLGDPLDHHFAFRRARAGGALPSTGAPGVGVAAIARGTLGRVLEVFAQAQRPASLACSAMQAVPLPEGATVFARVDGRRGVIRTGADEGCAFDLDDELPGGFALACTRLSATRVRVLGDAAPELARAARGLGVVVEHDEREVDGDAMAGATNLLQGSFAARGAGPFSRAFESLRRSGAWKAPAAWAAATLLLAVAGLNALWIEREAQLRQVRQGMREAFRDAIPEEPAIVDELGQARRAASALRVRAGGHSPDDFLALDAQAQRLLAQAPATLVASIEYADHSYRIRFRPGAVDDAALRDALHAQARRLGVLLVFDADGSALLSPAQ